jgi:hypothetical protein
MPPVKLHLTWSPILIICGPCTTLKCCCEDLCTLCSRINFWMKCSAHLEQFPPLLSWLSWFLFLWP